MRRSVVSSVVTLGVFTLMAAASGCVIVTQPGQNGAQPAQPAQTGNRSNVPVNQPRTATPAATTAAPTATATATATTTAAAGPAGPKVTVDGKEYTTLSKAVAFGNGENKPGTFRGLVYFLPTTTTALPNFDSIAPAGVLFTPGFAISSSNYSEGFPGLDAGRVDYFGIRYEGDFAVSATGEFTFKLESDDGARLAIDSLSLITLDGVHTSQSKSGTVKLAPGPHRLRLDYFQAAKGAVALKVAVTPPGGSEKPFAALF